MILILILTGTSILPFLITCWTSSWKEFQNKLIYLLCTQIIVCELQQLCILKKLELKTEKFARFPGTKTLLLWQLMTGHLLSEPSTCQPPSTPSALLRHQRTRLLLCRTSRIRRPRAAFSSTLATPRSTTWRSTLRHRRRRRGRCLAKDYSWKRPASGSSRAGQLKENFQRQSGRQWNSQAQHRDPQKKKLFLRTVFKLQCRFSVQ